MAKEQFVHAYPADFELVRSIAARVAWSSAWGPPLIDLQTSPGRAPPVTLDQANVVTIALPDRAFFLLIGDREKMEAALAGLGLANVTLCCLRNLSLDNSDGSY